MTRRNFLSLAPALLTGATRPPNVLLINTDDQRFDTIRALGNPQIITPALDGLAHRGMWFSNVYSQGGLIGAMCLPSRTMLMTGRSVFHIPGPKDPPGDTPLLAKAFESAGYTTFHVGKRGNTYVPASQAFQTCIFSESYGNQRAIHSEKHADAVIEHMNSRHADTPFFVYMAPSVPHDPRVAPPEFMRMYDPAKLTLPRNYMPEHPFDNGDLKIRDEMLAAFPRTKEEMRRHLADYYACITCLDHHLGRILRTIDSRGWSGNTIVLFTSDQGLAVGGRHGLMGKQNLYEHFKSPLIIAGPGIRHGRSDALVNMHDLFPTLCGLAGIPIPSGVEGISLKPVIDGKQRKVRDYSFGVYKDVQRMVRDERHKLIWYPKAARFQLFDVVADPWELEDLSANPRFSAKVAQLKQRLREQQVKFDDKYAPAVPLQ